MLQSDKLAFLANLRGEGWGEGFILYVEALMPHLSRVRLDLCQQTRAGVFATQSERIRKRMRWGRGGVAIPYRTDGRFM